MLHAADGENGESCVCACGHRRFDKPGSFGRCAGSGNKHVLRSMSVYKLMVVFFAQWTCLCLLCAIFAWLTVMMPVWRSMCFSIISVSFHRMCCQARAMGEKCFAGSGGCMRSPLMRDALHGTVVPLMTWLVTSAK